MLRKLLFLFIFPLVLTNCGQPHYFPCKMHIKHGFTEEEQNIIIEVASEWEEATNGIVEFNLIIGEPINSDHYIVRKHSYDYDYIQKRGENNRDVRGLAFHANFFLFSDPGPIWLIVDNIRNSSTSEENYYEIFRHVIRHEIGHHVGLEHADKNDSSAMLPYSRAAQCITQRDLQAFCALYDCDWHDLKGSCISNI